MIYFLEIHVIIDYSSLATYPVARHNTKNLLHNSVLCSNHNYKNFMANCTANAKPMLLNNIIPCTHVRRSISSARKRTQRLRVRRPTLKQTSVS